jgi:outer membrane receptor protein involved in Fe transport
MKNRYPPAFAALAVLLMSAPVGLWAQAAQPTGQAPAKEEEVIVLSPFEVSSEATTGYAAATTLAGNRLATELRDIGNAVTVVTSQFLKDIGATDNKSLLQYTTNTEVGGFYGNFAGLGDSSHLDESSKFTNPNQNTRIRGLTAADNTRDYFLTDIPWEGYNIDGVDLQRGPNSILFGQGSPAGIINTRTKPASFKDSNEVTFRVGSWGSTRATLDINKVLLKNELAIRIAAVRNDEQFKQDPAYSLQKRIYGALRYEPGFLKKGSARTIFKANIEFGDIDSNNPRQLPPNDRITPWWYTGTYQARNVSDQVVTYSYLNKATPNSWENEDDNTGLPNHGWDRPSHNGPGGNYLVNGVNLLIPKYANDPNYASGSFSGGPNEYSNPWTGGSMLGVFGSPAYNFQFNDPTQPAVGINWEPTSNHGMTSSGVNGVGTGFLSYLRQASINSYSAFAQKARLYEGNLPAWQFGIYKDKSLTDASVFDFYNQLFDGPTKHEFQNFRTYNLSWTQTFLNDRLGFEATYNNEWYKSGKVQLLTDDSLNIDIAPVYNDGSNAGKNGIPFADSTPNPNLGKPYVGGSGLYGNNRAITNREAGRLTVFADYDFNENHSSWLTRLLGRHVLTGLLAGDTVKINNLDFARYSIDDPAWERVVNSSPTDNPNTRLSWMDGRMQPFVFIYLGNSLMGATSASGAHIPNPEINPALKSAKVINFDATWKPSTNPADPSYVDPAGYWHNPYYPLQNPIAIDGYYRDGDGNILTPGPTNGIPGDSTQSNNPANYVGFRQYNINIIDSLDSEANLLRNTHDARLTKSKVFSRAFNWQAHFWDNAVVATFGVRKDMAKSWAYSLNQNSASSTKANYQRLNLSDSNYHLPTDPDNTLTVTSHAWTGVVHLNQLPYLKRLPIQVSLFYNHSTDFQPEAKRVDVYGVPLSAPSGKTKDVGFLLETNDGKYSLKVNKYNTDSVGASSAALSNAWFIGASQAWAANWVNRFEFNWKNDTIADAADPSDADYATNTLYNYGTAPGETQADAAKREASVIAAWRAWQKSVDPRFYAAWGINLNDKTKSVNSTVPNGFAVTEDSSSQGYEIEFNASPIRNWRITMNASKTTAQRKNIGGTNLRAFMEAYTKALNTPGPGYSGVVGGVGDLRIWWGGAGNTTTLLDWNGGIGSEFNQRKLQEGTNVPELRKWRWNAITNYDFDRGFLKGVNVGGGVRYESSIVIGYRPIAGATANDISFDIDNPYRGPSETNYDLWIGYSRRLWRNIDWNIQFNIRNLGVGNELIPITTQPDGSAAAYRIRAPQAMQLTNTFRF